VKILEKSKKSFTIIEYLKDGFTYNQIKSLLKKLNLSPIDIIRVNDSDYKANFKKGMKDSDLIELIIKYPKIFERPIIVRDEKAVIGRPPENIYKIL
tara:strand:- start:7 stop:297 length:291 start_codon:yes stop_codon:yes gene_type:complete